MKSLIILFVNTSGIKAIYQIHRLNSRKSQSCRENNNQKSTVCYGTMFSEGNDQIRTHKRNNKMQINTQNVNSTNAHCLVQYHLILF